MIQKMFNKKESSVKLYKIPASAAMTRMHGFTLIEFVVVISLISILGVIVLDRYWQWQQAAEQAALETTIGNLKSTVGMEVARRALNNELHLIPVLVNRNPMELLAQKPANYRGEFSEPFTEPQTWYYDKTRRELVYNVASTKHVQSETRDHNKPADSTDARETRQLRFRVKLIFNDQNHNGQFDKGDGIAGLDIVSVTPYHWYKAK